ncbi:MAG: hypothetical protein K6A44_03205 [bacterium]|nr:hypothetical protein [bacterium]
MTSAEYVSALENKLFGVTYEGQNIDNRIDRIEKQIYDNVYAGTPEVRLSKIDKIYPQSDFERTTNNNQSYYNNQEYYEEIPEADYNNYPIVSKIERTIYQKDYSGEDIYKRLSRLENELYGSEKSNLTLQERVENLKSVLPKKERHSVASNFSYDKIDNGGGYFDTDKAITALEKGAFRKTFELDDDERRLSRLEHYYFGQTSAGQPADDRITRLATVATADKESNSALSAMKNAQWAEILMNLLIIGLGFIL